LTYGRIVEFYQRLDTGEEKNAKDEKRNPYWHFLQEIGKEYEIISGIEDKILNNFAGIQKFTEK
jgi:hypothetical protein